MDIKNLRGSPELVELLKCKYLDNETRDTLEEIVARDRVRISVLEKQGKFMGDFNEASWSLDEMIDALESADDLDFDPEGDIAIAYEIRSHFNAILHLMIGGRTKGFSRNGVLFGRKPRHPLDNA